MTSLVSIKEKLKGIYAEYGLYIVPVLKFLLAFAVFQGINHTLPYMEALSNIFLLLVLALICSIMPMGTMFFFGMVLIVGQCYGVGLEVAGFALVMLLAMLILYIRFAPEDVTVLVLTPLAFMLHIPCAVPLGYGLKRSPSACVSAVCGVIVYYFMRQVNLLAENLEGAEEKNIAENLKILLDGLLKNREMLMQIVAFAAVLILVHAIRRVSVNYARQIAILSGTAAYLIILLAGGALKDSSMSIGALLAGTIFSLLITEVLEFFWYHVDYTRTEYLQYEDDEYYYYVKAVPKVVGIKTQEKRPEPSVNPVQAQRAVQPIQNQRPPMSRQSAVSQQTAVFQETKVSQDTMVYAGGNGGTELPENMDISAETPDNFQTEEVDYESKLEESLKEL